MRENISESLRMRELMDKELAENVIKKEAQINKLYSPSVSKPLNIHENSVKKIGQSHLIAMHKTNDE